MKKLGIREEDLTERFILGSGRGGQKIQKTHSCVQLKHIPTGIEIKCQKERLREANRYWARVELCDRIEARLHKEQLAKKAEIAKLRQQKRRPSKAQKARTVESKRRLGKKKSLRRPPKPNDD